VEIGDPKEGEVRVRNKAIGVNFIDVYFRTGVYKVPSLPYTPGFFFTATKLLLTFILVLVENRKD